MRRHLAGLGLAVLMVLAMFFAGAWGYVRLLRLPAASNALASALPAHGGSLLATHGVLAAVGAIAVTGLLAGILIAYPRISPFAPGLAGLFMLAWEALYLVSVDKAVAIIPLKAHAFGAGWEGLLFNGILGAAGLMLITPFFVPSRWRGRRDDDEYGEDDEEEDDDYAGGLRAGLRQRMRPGGRPAMRSPEMATDQIPVGAMAGGPQGGPPGGPQGPRGPWGPMGAMRSMAPRPGMMRRPPRALPPGGGPGPGGPGPNGPGGPGGPGPGPVPGPGPGPGRPAGPDFGDAPTSAHPIPGGPGPYGPPPAGPGDPRMRPRPFRGPSGGF